MPEFSINMLNKQYGEEKVKEILEGYSKKRKVTFRVNTLKSNNEEIENILKEKNIKYKKVPFYENAYILENVRENEIKNLNIYDEGKIYMQSLSSMLPPIILNPKQNMDILDMTAAPGGKTTQIAALVENKSRITAVEMNKIRAERLKYNVEKQGATSVYIMEQDARKIDDFFSFDSILLDAPCSGSGTIFLEDLKQNGKFTEKLIEKSVKAQKALLKKAINILKKGSEMVYSTCSILQEENENIILEALKTNKVEIVEIEFNGIDKLPKLPTKIKQTLCVLPNEEYEGFFVAKLRKL